MRRVVLIPTLLALILVFPVRADEEVPPAPPSEVTKALKTFEKEFKDLDPDLRIKAIGRLAKRVDHSVAKRLFSLLSDREPDIRIAAATALAGQTSSAATIQRGVKPLLSEKKIDPGLLAALVRTVGTLKLTALWEEVAALLRHSKDEPI